MYRVGIEVLVVFALGFAAGGAVPYMFNIVAMILRHCGGME